MQNPLHPHHTKTALASLCTAGLIAVVPFLLPHHGLATAFYSEWVAFAFGILACFPFLSKNFWLHLEVPRSAIWLLAIVALIALQASYVDHAYVTQPLLPGLYIVWTTALLVLCAWIRKQLGVERSVALVAWLVFIGGVLHTLVALVQYFDVSGELISVIDRKSVSTYGNIGQQNHFATQITLASFALIYLHANGRIYRSLAITLLASFALVLTASSSRAASAYIIAGIALSFVAYRATGASIHRQLLRGTGLLLVLFLAFQFMLPFLNDWLKVLLGAMGFDTRGLDVLVTLQRNAADGVDVRLSEWRKAWRMFMESPFWGVGIGNYGWYSFNYQALPEFSVVPKGELFQHSHNLIMQILAELGIAGLLLLAFMATSWFRQMLPSWKNPALWLILASVIVLLLHSSVEHPLWYSYFLGIAAILIGLGSEETLKIRFTPGLGQFTAGVTLIFSGAMLVITLLGLQDLIHVHRLVAATSPQQAFARLDAVSKNPILTPWAEVSIALHGVPDSKMIEQQLRLTTRVMHYRPNPHNVNRQIAYLALAGKPAEATALMQKTLIVYRAEFPKYACNWKLAPVKEIRRLWKEAVELTNGTIECPTETGTTTGSS